MVVAANVLTTAVNRSLQEEIRTMKQKQDDGARRRERSAGAFFVCVCVHRLSELFVVTRIHHHAEDSSME